MGELTSAKDVRFFNKGDLDNFIDTELAARSHLDIHNGTAFSLLIAKIGRHCRPNLNNINELNDRFEYYVELCCKYNQPCTEVGFAQSIGVHRSTFWDWSSGRRRELDSSYADTVKKWKQFFEGELSVTATYAKNPAGAIFLLKNNHGYQDKQEIEVTPRSNLEPELSVDQIIEKLDQDIPVDVDYTEE